MQLTIALLMALRAQQPTTPVKETVVVTGTYQPVGMEEMDRAVRSLPVRNLALLSNTLSDFLKLDPSLDLRSRAPNGLQADLSIRGSSFGQTLVLIDGQRVNDAQSGHHNMDIPLPLEGVDRIEVLRGSGSAMYGSDAVGGVINIVTHRPESVELTLRGALGNFGTNQQRATLGFTKDRLTQYFTASRDFSTGFIPNRDYRNGSVASSTWYRSTRVTLAYNDRPFGAEQFYGNFNSWERTKTWLASARQGLGENTSASFTYRRHTDLFVLYRDRPQVFTNHHISETYTGALRHTQELGSNMRLHFGGEGYGDTVVSSNLGQHSRARGAGYAAFDMRALKRFSLNAALREEVYRGFPGTFSPSISGGVWLAPQWKLRASVSRAFRVPTYTDLYYRDPANLGSPFLRPESAWSYEGGLDWNNGRNWRASATVFQRRERDGIDYIRSSPAEIWRAMNIQRLRFTGVELSAQTQTHGQTLEVAYTGLHGAQTALGALQSKYAFNYPVHSGVFSWTASSLPYGMLARTRVGALERLGRDPYAVWDLYLARNAKRIRPFLQFTNLNGAVYQEIPGVVMPGRAIVGGIEIAVFGASRSFQ
ncbi:hypothetical protein F183_A41740 [Bryobacterales bacterium F-183]|nr:hypothetical protein F183_A41740 [Bryobacterales bacterium F-183]